MLSYVNTKGKAVGIEISANARRRFLERWKVVFPNKSMGVSVDEEIEQWFRRTNRVQNLKRKEKQWLKHHGQDTLYFRTSHFTFVVQDGVLRTVELSDAEMRQFNAPLPLR